MVLGSHQSHNCRSLGWKIYRVVCREAQEQLSRVARSSCQLAQRKHPDLLAHLSPKPSREWTAVGSGPPQQHSYPQSHSTLAWLHFLGWPVPMNLPLYPDSSRQAARVMLMGLLTVTHLPPDRLRRIRIGHLVPCSWCPLYFKLISEYVFVIIFGSSLFDQKC